MLGLLNLEIGDEVSLSVLSEMITGNPGLSDALSGG